MTVWIRYNKGNCPACQGARKDCRKNKESGLIHCLGVVEAPGLKFVGTDSIGFNMFAEDKGEEWKPREYVQKEKKLKPRGMGAASRNREYQKVLEQLSLSDDDKCVLERRANHHVLTSVAKSYEYGQLLNDIGSVPGVRGRFLGVSGKGIIFPVTDVDKNITALRIHHPDNPEKKYVWVSSGEENPLHLPCGELPITVIHPQKRRDKAVYVIEGMEIKPRIVSEMMGAVVIGIPGASMLGNFPVQFARILGKLKPSEVVYLPDAGAVNNPVIRPAIEKLFGVVEKLQFPIRALWWGQVDKGDGDADEVSLATLRKAKKLGLKQLIAAGDTVTGLRDKITTAVKSVRRLSRKLKLLKGKDSSIINHLPRKEDYNGEIVEYDAKDGAAMYELAGRLGYKVMLDNSQTGAGKTHVIGQLQPTGFFEYADDGSDTDSYKKLIYCTQGHRNPNSVALEEDFYEMPSRHPGLELDYDKLTPAGSPYRVALADDTPEHLRSAASCISPQIFIDAYAKGHSTKGLCKACPKHKDCQAEQYMYLYKTRQLKGETKIRANLSGVPDSFVDENTVIAVDESEVAEWVKVREVTDKDIRRQFKWLKDEHPEYYAKLLPLKDSLLDILAEDKGRWGFNKKQILDRLEIPDGIRDDLEAIRLLEESSRPEIRELQQGKELHANFIYDLLAIAWGLKKGSLSCHSSLTMTMKNSRTIETLKKSHLIIFQDATHSRKQLAEIMEMDESEILLMRQKVVKTYSAKVHQYVGAGLMGNHRSESEQKRAELIRSWLKGKYPESGFIEHKAHAKNGDLIHGGDARGSNLFQTRTVVTAMGLYRPNLSAVLDEYQAITGRTVDETDEGFSEWYNHKQAANVVQEFGRLRANRRLKEQLIFNVIGDGDLSFLKELGVIIEVFDLGAINPDFCTPEDRARARNIETAKGYIREFGESAWQNMTLLGFTDLLLISRQSFYRWLNKHFGSFERFKQFVSAIMNPTPTPGEYNEKAVENVRLMLSMAGDGQFDPERFMNDIGLVLPGGALWPGWDDFLEGVRRMSMNYAYPVLFRLIKCFI